MIFFMATSQANIMLFILKQSLWGKLNIHILCRIIQPLALKFPRNRENTRIPLMMTEHEFRESSGVLYVGV